MRASDSATVWAHGSTTVWAYDSATVRAYGSATVEASKYVAVHLHSARVTLTGGVGIDLTKLDLTRTDEWITYTGCRRDGDDLVVYKAVRADLNSARGFAYPIGREVTDPQWRDDHDCGNGLHFSPSPSQALYYDDSATRYLECRVAAADVRTIPGGAAKLKAPRARVVREVDVNGGPIEAS